MSGIIYSDIPTPKTVTIRPTSVLRWNNGVLEQLWEIEEISPTPGIAREWRPVPTDDQDPARQTRGETHPAIDESNCRGSVSAATEDPAP